MDALEGVEFVYPENGQEEEAAIAEAGVGVYLTVTGGTARDHGLVLGEQLFPSETVLLENTAEIDEEIEAVRSLITGGLREETELWA
jgi:ATP phosphoribosyltransferase